jgi:Gly-Xaa carboxypeptidase
VALKYDLTFVDSTGKSIANGSEGTVRVKPVRITEPSPITQWTTPQWSRFSAAVVSAFGEGTIVSPSLSVANTDTKHYWRLSKNIMRWSPARLGTRLNAHTVNERVMLSTHIEGVKFYHGECHSG